MAGDIESSSIFGVRIADSFGTVVSPQSHVVIGVAVALMCLMLFAMQWLLIHRNTPKDAMDSPQFRTQKLTAFVFPGHLRGVGRHLAVRRAAVLADQ